MPELAKDAPDHVRQYQALGVRIDFTAGQEEAWGDCPFCGEEGKFSVSVETSKCHCKRCHEGKNFTQFQEWLWEEGVSRTGEEDYNQLARSRRLLSGRTLWAWGVVKNFLTDEWLVPGFDQKGQVRHLYRYVKLKDKSVLMALPGVKHQVFGGHLPELEGAETVYWCEGPWDAMALWEVLSVTQDRDGELVRCLDGRGLLDKSAVLATPGCGVFPDTWCHYFKDRTAVVLFDNDHPKKHRQTGEELPPAGFSNARRVCGTLMNRTGKPAYVFYLLWGKEGFDPELPSGFDVRDHLTDTKAIDLGRLAVRYPASLPDRIQLLGMLLDRLQPAPEEWKDLVTASAEELLPIKECGSWKALVNQWRRAMKWTEGMDRALSVMLASVISVETLEDQLWLLVLSPPSTGKSSLCEALAVNRHYVLPKDTIKGFYSGYQTNKEGSEDTSLVYQMRGKTLVIKDGDTILRAPNREQILSEARVIYDRNSRTSYRNQMSREYMNLHSTIIISGTHAMRELDHGELGDRFLHVVPVTRMEDELEDLILDRVELRAMRNMGVLANGKAESREDPAMVLAKQLTGGYVDHLRKNAADLIQAVSFPPGRGDQLKKLAKYVSYMRARPSKKQHESPSDRECAARLLSQLIKLAGCLAAVLGRQEVDDEVMRRVRKTGQDTARGRTQLIVSHLYRAGYKGAEVKSLCAWTGHRTSDENELLRFLRSIGAAYSFPGKNGNLRWKLTDKMKDMYKNAHDL